MLKKYIFIFFGFIVKTSSLSIPSELSKCKIFYPQNKEKCKTSALFLPFTVNDDIISWDPYSNFIDNNVKNDIKVFLPKSLKNIEQLCDEITDSEENDLLLISHSNSVLKSIDICNNNEKIKSLVLIDPLDSSKSFDEIREELLSGNYLSFANDFYNSIPQFTLPKFPDIPGFIKILLGNEENKLKDLNVEKLLIISNGKTDNWNLLPIIPPIGVYRFNISGYDTENTYIETIYNEDFGHFDLLDSKVSDVLHIISKGADNRDNVNSYQEDLSKNIFNFSQKTNNLLKLIESS